MNLLTTTTNRLSAVQLAQHGIRLSVESIAHGPGYFGGGWRHTYLVGNEIWAVEFRSDINQWGDGYYVQLASDSN